MKVVDIADELYRELSYPTDVSIPVIGFWLRTNLGTLNNLVDATYILNNVNLEITPDMALEEKAIFKKMYIIHYFDIQVRSVLGAAAVDSVIEVSADGATVRKINRNELSKTYLSLRKEHVIELETLITSYKRNKFNPIQVVGDDTVIGFFQNDSQNSYRNDSQNNRS